MSAGLLLIDKPKGISSAQVVGRIKRLLHPKKIGHAGTLDPLATGLLVCLLDQATRLASFAESGSKTYSGIFRFGITTESDDLDGAILSTREVDFTDDALQQYAKRFIGTIQQTPPRVSAIKVDGQRAYDMVRQNQEVTLASREVTIEELTLERLDTAQARYRVRCSKGTYIRSIARDIGELLGCGGAVETLRREGSSPFSVNQAVILEELSPAAILPWQLLFPNSPLLRLDASVVRALAGGDQRPLHDRDTVSRGLELLGSGAPHNSKLLMYAAESGPAQGLITAAGEALRLGLHIG